MGGFKRSWGPVPRTGVFVVVTVEMYESSSTRSFSSTMLQCVCFGPTGALSGLRYETSRRLSALQSSACAAAPSSAFHGPISTSLRPSFPSQKARKNVSSRKHSLYALRGRVGRTMSSATFLYSGPSYVVGACASPSPAPGPAPADAFACACALTFSASVGWSTPDVDAEAPGASRDRMLLSLRLARLERSLNRCRFLRPFSSSNEISLLSSPSLSVSEEVPLALRTPFLSELLRSDRWLDVLALRRR